MFLQVKTDIKAHTGQKVQMLNTYTSFYSLASSHSGPTREEHSRRLVSWNKTVPSPWNPVPGSHPTCTPVPWGAVREEHRRNRNAAIMPGTRRAVWGGSEGRRRLLRCSFASTWSEPPKRLLQHHLVIGVWEIGWHFMRPTFPILKVISTSQNFTMIQETEKSRTVPYIY